MSNACRSKKKKLVNTCCKCTCKYWVSLWKIIKLFDGTNFEYWNMQIEDYLYGRKLHQPLIGEQPNNMDDDQCALLDRQVLGVIRLTLSRSVTQNIVKEKTTVGLMATLSSMYRKSSANNKVHLMMKLFNLKMRKVL